MKNGLPSNSDNHNVADNANNYNISILCVVPMCLHCFDAVVWVAGRASGL